MSNAEAEQLFEHLVEGLRLRRVTERIYEFEPRPSNPSRPAKIRPVVDVDGEELAQVIELRGRR